MRALLLLSVVGLALYALLVLTSNVVPDGKVEDTFAGKTQPNHPIDRELRSWGANIPALANSQRLSPRHPQQHVAHTPTERMSGADQPAASPGRLAASEFDSSKQDHVEWTKVMLAARVHSEASVSSPTIRFYRPGTELQVVSRENGWLQLLEPVTQDRGWVFEKYLVSIDGPSPTQAAMESITKPLPTKVASPKSQKLLSSNLTVRAGDVEITKSDRRRGRWARRDDRRRDLGLFGFFRGREAGPAAWSIGSAR